MMNERLLAMSKGVAPKYLVVLYLVLVIALGLGVSSVILYPQEVHFNQLEAQLKAEKQKVAVVENFVLSHPNMDQYLAELQQAIHRAEAALPGTMDVSTFLAQLEKDAREAGVKLTNVKPAAVAERQGYRELPVEISVEGSFLGSMSFLKKMEDGSRFTVPTAFLIQQKKDVLATRLNLQIFSYGNSPKPAAGTPPAGKAPAGQAPAGQAPAGKAPAAM